MRNNSDFESFFPPGPVFLRDELLHYSISHLEELSWPSLPSQPKVLLVGATGRLGKACVQALDEQDIEAHYVLRPEAKNETLNEKRVIRARIDGATEHCLTDLRASGFFPDIVICAQGQTGLTGEFAHYYWPNVQSVENLAKFSQQVGARMVSAGSLSVFVSQNSPPPEVCFECERLDSNDYRCIGAYTATKWIAERKLLSAKAAVLRLGWLVERASCNDLLAEVLSAFLTIKKTVSAAECTGPEASFDCLPVDAAAKALVRYALLDQYPGVMHMAGESPISVEFLLETLKLNRPMNVCSAHDFRLATHALPAKQALLLNRAFLRQDLHKFPKLFNFDLFQSSGTAFDCGKAESAGLVCPEMDQLTELIEHRVFLAKKGGAT